MFDQLKKDIENKNVILEEAVMLQEMSDDGAPEDSVMESLAVPEDDSKEIESLLSKVPDTPFEGKEELTSSDLKHADNVEDPSIDELLIEQWN